MSKNNQYDISIRYNKRALDNINKILKNTHENLSGIGIELKHIMEAEAFVKVAKEAENAKKDVDKLKVEAEKFGKMMSDSVEKFAKRFFSFDGTAATIKKIYDTAVEYESALSQMQAATGMTARDMEQVQQSVNRLYKEGLGKSFGDLASAATTVRQATRTQGVELESLTRKALVYRDVFGEGVNDSIQSADILMRQFGVSGDQAYNLMAQGAQKGLNKSGELLGIINKYSEQFSSLGFSAEEMFALFSSGAAVGEWSLGSIGDLVDDFDKRIKDIDNTALQNAMTQLFAPDDLDLMKSTPRSADIFKGVLTQLAKVEDPLKRHELGIAILGEQYGSFDGQVTESLSAVNTEFDSSKSTLEEVASIKFDNLQADWKKLGREMMVEFVEPMAQIVLPILKDLVDWTSKNKDALVNLAGVFVFASAAKGLVNTAISFGQVAVAAKNAAASAVLLKNASGAAQMQTGAVVVAQAGAAVAGNKGKSGKARGKQAGKAASTAPVAANAAGIAQVGTVASTTANSVLKASKAATALRMGMALMGGPVGIAIAGIGAVGYGVMEYKRRQDEARQSLFNMGQELGQAFSNYENVSAHTEKVSDLIEEYKLLDDQMKSGILPADELATSRQRLQEVEELLINMNPDILKSEDAKTDRFRQQLDVVKEVNEQEQKKAHRALEKAYTDNIGKLDDLEKEQKKATEAFNKYEAKYDQALKDYKMYEGFETRLAAIINDSSLTSDQQQAAFKAVADDIFAATGQTYSDNNLGMYFDMVDSGKDAKKDYQKYYDKLEKAEAERDTATESIRSYYDSAKAYYEIALGESFEDAALKFADMTIESREVFLRVAEELAALNAQTTTLPDAFKTSVNVGILKLEADRRSFYNKDTAVPMDELAKGGFANRPSIIGEAGLEAAIPINNKPRSHQLLNRVNALMGHDTGSVVVHATFSPNVSIHGGGPNVAGQVRQGLMMAQDEFERMLRTAIKNERRLGFG